ncbi:ATP-binding protein [Comamonas sp. NLF-1-9]|uniref:sensor histidine kinase n=1 Tax=Comamonas sp. NLF-1-9 TaxID=2853163 RepID=UPI001C444732|nr:ATP-binding protein [Comamonas sp. NLF-1-9]QXL83388.1 two-component sensor histidine kinase [Comamonas sp. NLF-1-9]
MSADLPRLAAERDALREQLRSLAAANDELLHAVSHDLRAPLRHVVSYAGLLAEVLAEVQAPCASVSEAQGFAATLQRSARHMGQMLDGLLAISRAGRAPLHLAAVDLQAALQAAQAQLPGAAAVRWAIQTPMPAVQADAPLLQTLLLQLLGNAVKFSQGSAQVLVQVSARRVGEQVQVQIADQGAGFDPARAASLFQLFQSLHREGEFPGVGAGLALCRRIAERHGAQIAVSSPGPGQGCTVTLHWPAAQA